MEREHEKPSNGLSVSGLLIPSGFHPRGSRFLQLITLVLGVAWLIIGVMVSKSLIAGQIASQLHKSQQQLDTEASFRRRVFEQNLHQAEQLSRALAHNQSYIDFAKAAKEREFSLGKLEREQRIEYILGLPNLHEVNQSFKRLVNSIDAYQVFMQDHLGYCIASGRSGAKDDCLGSRYHTREYFQEAAKLGYGRQFAVGRLHPVPSFFFSAAIKDGKEFLGVIIVRLLTHEVTDFINPNQALSLVVSDDGVVIASSDESMIFRHVGMQWAPVPDIVQFRNIYKQKQMQTIPVQYLEDDRAGVPLWLWQGKRHLVGEGVVEQKDFRFFLLKDVEHIFSAAKNYWNLAIVILIAGLLIILLVERSVNFSRQRKTHLKALSVANKHLAEVSSELYEMTITDMLTGVSSRRYFSQKLAREVERQQGHFHTMPRSSNDFKGLNLLIIDIDEFKRINDSYGHPAGDEAIRSMASICVDSVRPQDTVGRMGGEEFAILLCDVTLEQSKEVAERILNKCRSTEITYEGYRFKQSVSIGLARLEKDQSADTLLSRADKALYAAKRAGRDCYKEAR